MTLECSHCGHRSPEGTQRCPNCLRSNGWLEVADKAKRPSRSKLLVIIASVAVAGGAIGGIAWGIKARKHQQQLAVQTGVATGGEQAVPAAFEGGPAVRALAAQCHAQAPLAKAREVLDAIRAKITSASHTLNDSTNTVPSVRTSDSLVLALSGSQSVFSSLDLARILAATLREAQVPFTFARRTSGTRPNTPPDPTGVLGRYVVIVDSVALDPTDGQAIARNEARPVVLEVGAITGAMLVQSALAEERAGNHARALTLIRSAVDQWGDGGIAHAARAFITRTQGVPPQDVLRDLDTAVVASNDDPAIHLLRAHTAVMFGEPVLARTSAQLAWQRARGWGDAALAAAMTYTPSPASDSGVVDRGRCERFLDARESWTDDALTACAALTTDGPATEPQLAAAQRVGASSTDPMRVAFAMAVRQSTNGFTVNSSVRQEVLGWLLLAGATPVARQLMLGPDAGQP